MGRGNSGRGKRQGGKGPANSAPIYDIDSVEKQINNKGGEGVFIKTDVPLLVRSDEGGSLVIKKEAGYATMSGGMPVFIQKTTGGYSHNVYGMNATMQPYKTLKEAKDPKNIKATTEKVKKAFNDSNQMKEIFNAANRQGGLSNEEYSKIVRRNRAKKQ